MRLSHQAREKKATPPRLNPSRLLGERRTPQPRRGTLTPLIPLSLKAIKGEGEIRTEGDVGADAPTSPSSSILGRGDRGWVSHWGKGGWGWVYAIGAGFARSELGMTVRVAQSSILRPPAHTSRASARAAQAPLIRDMRLSHQAREKKATPPRLNPSRLLRDSGTPNPTGNPHPLSPPLP